MTEGKAFTLILMLFSVCPKYSAFIPIFLYFASPSHKYSNGSLSSEIMTMSVSYTDRLMEHKLANVEMCDVADDYHHKLPENDIIVH